MSNVRNVAVSVVKAMLPTDTSDGIDVESADFAQLIDAHSEGEHFDASDLTAEVRRVLSIIGSGRLNSL